MTKTLILLAKSIIPIHLKVSSLVSSFKFRIFFSFPDTIYIATCLSVIFSIFTSFTLVLTCLHCVILKNSLNYELWYLTPWRWHSWGVKINITCVSSVAKVCFEIKKCKFLMGFIFTLGVDVPRQFPSSPVLLCQGFGSFVSFWLCWCCCLRRYCGWWWWRVPLSLVLGFVWTVEWWCIFDKR